MTTTLVRRVGLVTLALAGIVPAASANLILNGSFESNTAGTTVYNMDNVSASSIVADINAYGAAAEIDLMETVSDIYGLDPIHGSYKLGIHTVTPGGAQDEFSFDLSSGIVAGTDYDLSFYAHAVTDFDPGTNGVEIGVSTSATSFGTLVYSTGALSTTAWGLYSTTFTAPISGAYLTVRSYGGEETWSHIDGFDLTVVPEPTSLVVLGVGALALLRRRRR